MPPVRAEGISVSGVPGGRRGRPPGRDVRAPPPWAGGNLPVPSAGPVRCQTGRGGPRRLPAALSPELPPGAPVHCLGFRPGAPVPDRGGGDICHPGRSAPSRGLRIRRPRSSPALGSGESRLSLAWKETACPARGKSAEYQSWPRMSGRGRPEMRARPSKMGRQASSSWMHPASPGDQTRSNLPLSGLPRQGQGGAEQALLRVAVPEELLLPLRRQGDAPAPRRRRLGVPGDGLVVVRRRAVRHGLPRAAPAARIGESAGGDHGKRRGESGHRFASSFRSCARNSSGRGQLSSTGSPLRGWTNRSPTAWRHWPWSPGTGFFAP